MSFQQLNDKLANAFLKRLFFDNWKGTNPCPIQNFRSLELIVNYRCNLGCEYCYVNRFGDILYSPKLYDDETVLVNTIRVMNWLEDNDYHPRIDIFSGEPLVQSVALDVIDHVLDYKPKQITVPTNYTWFPSDRVNELMSKAKKFKVSLGLSASFDGKFCETNRPKKGTGKPHEYPYEEIFKFIRSCNGGIHPMVYSRNIENWKDNFLWFQEQMGKANIPWWCIYLLEVRNANWTTYQCNELYKFTKFLVTWSWDKCNHDLSQFVHFLFKQRGFNMLSNPFTTIGRGIGCSLQSTLPIRLGDLALVPCHRTSYDPFLHGYLEPEKNNIRVKNIELLIAKYTFDSKNFPYCEQCVIRELCSQGCPGSQYETTGDLFTPIPSVCRMEHAKVLGIIHGLRESETLRHLYSCINYKKKHAINEVIRCETRRTVQTNC